MLGRADIKQNNISRNTESIESLSIWTGVHHGWVPSGWKGNGGTKEGASRNQAGEQGEGEVTWAKATENICKSSLGQNEQTPQQVVTPVPNSTHWLLVKSS